MFLSIRTVLLLISFVCVSGAALAQNAPLSMMTKDGSKMRSDASFVYLLGAANGVAAANTTLLLSGKAPMYCSPLDYVLSPEEFFHLAEAELQGPHKPDMIVIAAISALGSKFPCPEKRR